MDREEFLKQLQESLSGRVSDSAIRENVTYYSSYIREQVDGGKTESEVISMLGNPRLLAKTIEESVTFAADAAKTQGSYNGFYDRDAYNTNGDNNYRSNDSDGQADARRRQVRIPAWLAACLAVVLIGFLLIFTFRVFVFLAPAIVTVLICVFIYRLVRSWFGRF